MQPLLVQSTQICSFSTQNEHVGQVQRPCGASCQKRFYLSLFNIKNVSQWRQCSPREDRLCLSYWLRWRHRALIGLREAQSEYGKENGLAGVHATLDADWSSRFHILTPCVKWSILLVVAYWIHCHAASTLSSELYSYPSLDYVGSRRSNCYSSHDFAGQLLTRPCWRYPRNVLKEVVRVSLDRFAPNCFCQCRWMRMFIYICWLCQPSAIVRTVVEIYRCLGIMPWTKLHKMSAWPLRLVGYKTPPAACDSSEVARA